MPTFTYTGITAAGQQIDGVVEAFDEIEAMERAREQCRVVQSVVPVREGKNLLSMDITKPKAKQKNLAVMCAQFATILNAGVPAARATSLVADQVTDKYLKRVLADVAADVASGHSLAESFQSRARTCRACSSRRCAPARRAGICPRASNACTGTSTSARRCRPRCKAP